MSTKDSANTDPATDFLGILNDDEITISDLTSIIAKSREMISLVPYVPANTTILNYEIFTRRPFSSSSRDHESQSFTNAILSVFKFIYALYKICRNPDKIKEVSDQVRSNLHDDWPNCVHCPELQHVMKAAFGVVADDSEFLDSSYQPKYIKFLANVVLLQTKICQLRFFSHILTSVAEIFVLIPVRKYQSRINTFRESERKDDAPESEQGDFQSFLRLVGNISRLRKGNDDFAYRFHKDGNVFIQYATDFVSKPLFATIIDTLAALTQSEALANEFYKRLNDSLSDIVNMRHLIEVFNEYAEDFQVTQITRQRLDYYDTISLQAILRLFSQLFHFCKDFRKDLLDDQNNWNFIPSLFNLIISAIPASLKSCCFDTLASIATSDKSKSAEIWNHLNQSQILTKEFLDNNKGGIISDIDIIEADAKSYPLLRSFVAFLSSFLESEPSPELLPKINFNIYHQFLMEQCLLRIRSRIFNHRLEKWSLLSKICQCWTNLLLLNNKDTALCLMKSALSDSRFFTELFLQINEDEAPEETLLCIYRLILLIIEKEDEYLEMMDPADRVLHTPIGTQFSWESSVLVKLIQCVSSNDDDLVLTTLNLVQHLAKDSPSITQFIFSRPQAKAIYSFKKVICRNDEPETEERNARNTLLEMLISLGPSSPFLRYVCHFNLDDPPMSLMNSSLEKGILLVLLKKMKDTEAPKNYPRFAANTLKLFLIICNNPFTSKPLLDFLRNSDQSFFDKQLRLLQETNCSLISIGCFLQLLAREAMDSMRDLYNNITLNTFRILMETDGLREQERRRIVLFDEFIDRIDDSESAENIAMGIFEVTIAFINSTSALQSMLKNCRHWISNWIQYLIHFLSKVNKLHNPTSIRYLIQSIGFVSHFLFIRKDLGTTPVEQRGEIFHHALSALSYLNQTTVHSNYKLGIYNLISCMDLTDLENVLNENENDQILIISLRQDLDNRTPVFIASIYAAAESIIPIIDSNLFKTGFVLPAIQMIADESVSPQFDFNYIAEQKGAAEMISSRYSFFNRLLVEKAIDYLDILIDNSLISKIGSNSSFWDSIRKSYHTSVQYMSSETTLEIASKALRVLTLLEIQAKENEKTINEITELYKQYSPEQLIPCLTIPEIMTISALQFLFDLTVFLTFSPPIISQTEELKAALHNLKIEFMENPESIKDRIRQGGLRNRPNFLSIENMKIVDALIEKFQKLFQ